MTTPIHEHTGRALMRARKRRNRNAWWLDQLAKAGDGREALMIAWRWALSTYSRIEERNPAQAEANRWEIARGIARAVAIAPDVQYEMRKGITDQEYADMLDPKKNR